MSQGTQPESEADRLVRKMVTLNLSVSHVYWIRRQEIPGGERLRAENRRIAGNRRAGELTPGGIAEYIDRLKSKT